MRLRGGSGGVWSGEAGRVGDWVRLETYRKRNPDKEHGPQRHGFLVPANAGARSAGLGSPLHTVVRGGRWGGGRRFGSVVEGKGVRLY